MVLISSKINPEGGGILVNFSGAWYHFFTSVRISMVFSPQVAAEYLYDLGLAEHPQEHFVVLYLNTKNLIVGHTVISKGIMDRSLVHPREVFTPALMNGSTAKIILAHNHPSGDVTPSLQDRETTKRLIDAGGIMGIEVIDHLIVAFDLEKRKKTFFSFSTQGLIVNTKQKSA